MVIKMHHHHHSNVHLCFGKDGVLHLKPKNHEGAMALKYWNAERKEHGDKMLDVSYDVMDEPKEDQEEHEEEEHKDYRSPHMRRR